MTHEQRLEDLVRRAEDISRVTAVSAETALDMLLRTDAVVYLLEAEAYKKGQEAMRERAAVTLDDSSYSEAGIPYIVSGRLFSDPVRALPIEDYPARKAGEA